MERGQADADMRRKFPVFGAPKKDTEKFKGKGGFIYFGLKRIMDRLSTQEREKQPSGEDPSNKPVSLPKKS